MDRLEISTSERVALKLPLAGVGHRALAYGVDLSALFGAWLVLYFLGTLLESDLVGTFEGLSGLFQAVLVAAFFAAQWIYWTLSETLGGGQTLGKRLIGIRVRREDGRPLGLFDSALRNLTRVIDFLPALYAIGVLTMLLDERQRRLGDLLAGTVLVRERQLDLARYAQVSAPAPVPASRAGVVLGPADVELTLAFLERAPTLQPRARQALTRQFLGRYAPELPEQDRATLAQSPEQAEALLRARALHEG